MRKFKVNVKMRLCKTGLVLETVSFGIAVATTFIPSLWPIFTFSVVDYVLVHLLAYYFEVKEVSE